MGVGGIRPEHGLLLGLRLGCGLADRVICGERTLTGLQGEHRFDEDPAVAAVPRWFAKGAVPKGNFEITFNRLENHVKFFFKITFGWPECSQGGRHCRERAIP